MGETLKVPNEELIDLLDTLEPVEKQNWRHGHKDVYVFEKDAKHWRVTIDVHTSEGWDLVGDEQVCERVYPHQVTTTVWRTKPQCTLDTSSAHQEGSKK